MPYWHLFAAEIETPIIDPDGGETDMVARGVAETLHGPVDGPPTSDMATDWKWEAIPTMEHLGSWNYEPSDEQVRALVAARFEMAREEPLLTAQWNDDD